MNSKEIYHFPSIVFCLAVLLILVQYSSSQPTSEVARKFDDSSDSSVWSRPALESEMSESDSESGDSLPNFFVVHSAYNRLHALKPSEPVRRANFWKRANFWRKRANFW